MNNRTITFKIIRKIFILSIFFNVMCGCSMSMEKEDNPVLGSWFIKSKVYDDGKDMTKEMWEVWDALSYDFKPNGIVVVSGGPEPLYPTEYRYHLIGDSTLHIFRNYRGLTLEDHYSIISVSPDTIWLRCNASYLLYPDSVGYISSGSIEFLERI